MSFSRLVRQFLRWITATRTRPTPTPTATPTPEIAIFTVRVNPPAAFVTIGAREWPTRVNGIVEEEFPAGSTQTVTVRAPGYLPLEVGTLTMKPGRMPAVEVTLAPVPVVHRTGRVRLDNSAFADDAGEWNALGTTLFWALWGEEHDRERLEQNLAWASRAGYDYIRILGMVGSASWSDRVINPASPTYWTTVDKLCARLKRHGLRAQVTVFADADTMMPNAEDRRTFARAWANRAAQSPEVFLFLETANEYWQNGITSPQELCALTHIINNHTPVLVAASTPTTSYPEEVRTSDDAAKVTEWMNIYGDGAADVMTMHFDRDVTKSCGWWRPVRQPWEMQFGAFQTGVHAYVNNEPIGPESSVTSDDDPERIVMGAVVTWLTKGAAHTVHTGAGIRGGGAADRARGRSANLWEVANIQTITETLATLRKLLPPLANGKPKNGHWEDSPLATSNLNALCRSYHTVLPNNTFVSVLFGMTAPVSVTPRRNATLRAYRWTGEEIAATGAFTDSTIILGEWQ